MTTRRGPSLCAITLGAAALVALAGQVQAGSQAEMPETGPPPPLHGYGVDIHQTSVSGVSSGGAMAIQMHVAHSSIMRGIGVTGGIAYDCANSDEPFELQAHRERRRLHGRGGTRDALEDADR